MPLNTLLPNAKKESPSEMKERKPELTDLIKYTEA
jgi:hypothetical protein